MNTTNRQRLLHLPTLFMGLTFLCSALFKAIGIRTFGLTVDSFCIFLGMEQLYGMGLWLAAALCTGELLLGISAFHERLRPYTAGMSVIAMLLFTYLTGMNLASPYGQIESCGCFGEVIHLSAKATFCKNIILLNVALAAVICEWAFKIEKD